MVAQRKRLQHLFGGAMRHQGAQSGIPNETSAKGEGGDSDQGRQESSRGALLAELSQARTLQRVPIPGTDKDTTVIDPDPSLLAPFSVGQLMQFWRAVYAENGDKAYPWRLAICAEILRKLAAKDYGPVDRSLLQGLNPQQVETGLENKTPLGAGEIKAVAAIQVGDRELVAARLKAVMSEKLITDEVSMIQILGMLGVRVPALYGSETQTQPELPTDKDGKLNMIMGRVRTTQPAVIVWDMPVGALAERLIKFLKEFHGHEEGDFDMARTNMLRDLVRLRQVISVLTVCDLQILIEDETGCLVTFDPGAIVPRGRARDKQKEQNTIANIADACDQIAALKFVLEEKKENRISSKDAQYLGNFVDARDLLLRAHKVLKGAVVDKIESVTVTPGELRRLIKDNAGNEDLGDFVTEEVIAEAIELLESVKK